MHNKYTSSSWGLNQCALAERTSQMMKIGQDENIQMAGYILF